MPAASAPPSPAPGPVAARPGLGAAVGPSGVTYRVWAPDHPRLHVRIQRAAGGAARLRLARRPDRYFSGRDPAGVAGDRYFYELSDGGLVPDPASRFQPEGVHGPSECIDPRSRAWRTPWTRPPWRAHALYELHVGTFTPEGTFRAAIGRLDHLRDLGVTAIEIMPVADFPGARNWGYDGVMPFAPARCYGRPDDFRELVDAAHARGLAVVLDVVYNHLGPDGNPLGRFSRGYFRADASTPWGQALDFDGPGSGPVRDFFLANAAYWLDEFRCDGLRLDATHMISDRSEPHILAEIAAAVHARGAFVIAEDDRNDPRLLRDAEGAGFGLDAVWADDFQHQARVALTGERTAYLASYEGRAADLARTLAQGWFYTGQPFAHWNRGRGRPAPHLPPAAFIHCLENHDQVGNRPRGERLEQLISPPAFRAASMLLCLNPHAILLFMGQEWAASSPFLFFTDHAGELGRQAFAARRREHAAGRQPGAGDVRDPQAPPTFAASRLRWEEAREPAHAAILALHRECLRQRAAWIGSAGGRSQWRAAAIGEAVALRCEPPGSPARLLVALLRPGLRPTPADHALLRLPAGADRWRLVLHSEEPRFGGHGVEGAEPAGPGPAAGLWEAAYR
jgi:maltooligosyltrehalose trehalohydrolase